MLKFHSLITLNVFSHVDLKKFAHVADEKPLKKNNNSKMPRMER